MKTEKSEKTERTPPFPFALSALSVFSVLSVIACARIEPPPGGPPDAAPPRLIATRPDTLASLRAFKGAAEFQFDEVISEGGAPSQGEGTSELEKLVILSPSTRVPEVSWRRDRITVRPREGWRPNRVYRVELLPGVTDLRSNRSRDGAVLTFTTGAPRPQTTLQGQVVDWGTGRPAASGLVVATLLPDSLPYKGVADSNGRFSLGPLPQGEYLVTGVLDQNGDHRQDLREAYGTARVSRGRTEVGELWAFVHDTNPPRIQTVTVNDSVSATLAFTQQLDPRQRLTAKEVRLRVLPDSVPFPVASILPQPVDDSLHAARPPRDSAMAGDTTGRDTTGARRRVPPGLPGRARADEPKMSRPPLFDRLILRVPRPWAHGARLAVEVRGVRNVTGVAGNAVGVVVVPEKPKPAPRDTAAGPPERDTTGVRRPPRKPTVPGKI